MDLFLPEKYLKKSQTKTVTKSNHEIKISMKNSMKS